MSDADLTGAKLSGAKLMGADLSRANLIGADLSESLLAFTSLYLAKLSDANLSESNMIFANLRRADLSNSDLSFARMFGTVLTELDLSQVKGLASIDHFGPSDIGIQTIYLSHGRIPEIFLRGVGAPENFIEYLHSLVKTPIDYYTCFISHSSKDQVFAERLYADLQARGVRCWYAPHDLKIGEKFRDRIDESIRLHDKLLVILSHHSVESDWVEDEVARALDKERQHPERAVLFPIRLDEAVMTAHHAWASGIRLKRHIGDFTGWKDHDQYKQAFARLLRDLQAPDAPSPAV